jgi:hypothetical protein
MPAGGGIGAVGDDEFVKGGQGPQTTVDGSGGVAEFQEPGPALDVERLDLPGQFVVFAEELFPMAAVATAGTGPQAIEPAIESQVPGPGAFFFGILPGGLPAGGRLELGPVQELAEAAVFFGAEGCGHWVVFTVLSVVRW